MEISRRAFLALLGISPAAPAMSKIGQPGVQWTTMDLSIPLRNDVPVDLRDIACRAEFIPKLTLPTLLRAWSECCFGNEAPFYVVLSSDQWLEFIQIIPPQDKHWYVHSEVSARGFRTIQFQGAEAVKDTTLSERTIYIVNPNQMHDTRYNRKLMVHPHAAHRSVYDGRA